MKHKLILLTREQSEFAEKIEACNLSDLELLIPQSDEEIAGMITDANIMLGNPELAKNWINEAKNVTWMQSTFAGIDSMNDPTLRKDYLLTNVKDVYGEVMAEYVFGYVLLFEKEILENQEFQQQKRWERRHTSRISDKTIGIVGAGSIGSDIAKVGQAFGMNVLGYRSTKQPAEHFDEIYAGADLAVMLAQCDYVVSVLPNTKNTDDMFSVSEFAEMKSGAVFINVGRGNAVDEVALVDAVKNGVVARAVLDVMKEEPLPVDSPLWDTEHILITPHMSGNVVSDALIQIFSENYRRFIAGDDLLYVVDLQKGY